MGQSKNVPYYDKRRDQMENWSEVFSTGIDELDQDHKRMLRFAELIAERTAPWTTY
jgi:hypothetical protein